MINLGLAGSSSVGASPPPCSLWRVRSFDVAAVPLTAAATGALVALKRSWLS
jgi:hypothetical protein